MVRLARNPEILICWKGGRLLVEDLGRGERFFVSPETILLLDVYSRPRSLEAAAARALPDHDRDSVLRGSRELVRRGLLIPEKEARRRRSRLRAWKENLASAYYHVASRDIRFPNDPTKIEQSLDTVAGTRRPRRFKRYPAGQRRTFTDRPAAETGASLERVLAARRTVRNFSREPILLDDFAALVRGTWRRTGWLDAGPLGRLAAKTSPSAGALHPIECYVMAWNVDGLRRGLYHYDVGADDLRLLRAGDFREAAVKAASGQPWVKRAGFLCVMTAMFERTLWKYDFESAYRVVWLDAGHLAQTFCLLATSRGLGPFTTAAIQDTYIEKLIGLDGIKEFPVYLCGAGVPARKTFHPSGDASRRRPR